MNKHLGKSMNADYLYDYLEEITKVNTAGLIIAEDRDSLVILSSSLFDEGYLPSASWIRTLSLLAHNNSVYMLLNHIFTYQTYDLIDQYQAGLGIVQIRDPATGKLYSARFNPSLTRLLLVSTPAVLNAIEEKFPLKEKISLIARV